MPGAPLRVSPVSESLPFGGSCARSCTGLPLRSPGSKVDTQAVSAPRSAVCVAGVPSPWSLLPGPELLSWGPEGQGPRGLCSDCTRARLSCGSSRRAALPFHYPSRARLGCPGGGFDWFQRPGRSWLSTYSGPLPETFQGRMDHHVCVCEARCPVGSGTDVSACTGPRLPQTCPVRPLPLCSTWWRAVGESRFRGVQGGQEVCGPLFYHLF